MESLAILFTLFIIALIILANRGEIPPCIKAIYDFPNGDKVGHFILFGLLNFFITSAFLSRFKHDPKRIALSVGLILALAVAVEEFSQQYFSARTFDLMDLMASHVGVFIGGIAAWKYRK